MANNLYLPEETKAGFAPINGIDLYFETTGQGKPLLLLHAGVADSRMWDKPSSRPYWNQNRAFCSLLSNVC